MSKKLLSPLRYPGGKSKFAPYVASIMKNNNLDKGHYVEPYAGGAGVAFELLFTDIVSHIHINDLDPAIHLFWDAAINDTSHFIEILEATPITMDQWFYWRDVMNNKVSATNTEIGFATLFMNRTNRSGILKAGVIGGKAQNGQYELGDRFKKDVIAERIKRIASRRSQISIYKQDALELLDHCDQILPKNSLIYLDPPYYVKGQGLYRNFYSHEDHVAIANKLMSEDFKSQWIVSYDATPEIYSIYEGCQSRNYELSYTAQNKYQGQEVMFFCKDITPPTLSH